jgi:hypothetical protein
MNLLNISIIMSCNKCCSYCPVSKYLVPVDNRFHNTLSTAPYPFDGNNCINNASLLKWLDKYIDPKEFVIEITGGEPSLYKEIDQLLVALKERSYFGVIKTNGTMPLIKTDNIQRIVSWHEWHITCPENYDQVLIIRNPNDDWRKKVEYCEKNSIPYGTSLFDDFRMTGKSVNRQLGKTTRFLNITHVNNQGQVISCPKGMPDFYKSIFHDTPPTLCPLAGGCSHCGVAVDVETFLPDWLKEELK